MENLFKNMVETEGKTQKEFHQLLFFKVSKKSRIL